MLMVSVECRAWLTARLTRLCLGCKLLRGTQIYEINKVTKLMLRYIFFSHDTVIKITPFNTFIPTEKNEVFVLGQNNNFYNG